MGLVSNPLELWAVDPDRRSITYPDDCGRSPTLCRDGFEDDLSRPVVLSLEGRGGFSVLLTGELFMAWEPFVAWESFVAWEIFVAWALFVASDFIVTGCPIT